MSPKISVNPIKVLSVNISSTEILNIHGKPILSGINKRHVSGKRKVTRLGIAQDEQADLTVHGGLDKAVYAYPIEHYEFWQEQRKKQGLEHIVLPYGFLGENLTLQGILEQEIFIGDYFILPNCILKVTQPRQPCFKLNHVMGFNQASKAMIQSKNCGFYLSVEKEGFICSGDIICIEKGSRILSIADAITMKFSKTYKD